MDMKSENIIFDTVAIVGIGLIGSSIARGIQKIKLPEMFLVMPKQLQLERKLGSLVIWIKFLIH